jgi:hypothetical protein
MMRSRAARIVTRTGLIAGFCGVAWLAAARPTAAALMVPEDTAWGIEVALGECTLTGKIPGPQPIQVSLLTVTGSDSYSMSLVGRAVPRTPDREAFGVTIVLGGAEQRFDRKGRGARIDKELGNAIVVGQIEPEVVAAFGQSSSIGLEGKFRVTPVALSRADAAVRALRKCVRDQLVEWGADRSQFEPNGKTPVALIARDKWLSSKDWDAIEPRGSGAVDAVFRVSVAADGSIDGCTPVDPAPSTRVTTAACGAVLNRRLFTPASNPAGKPVRGVAVFEIHMHVVESITGRSL